MKITRILNNNAVGSLDKDGKEIIVLSKGIGFKKKKDDDIEEDYIEKIFHSPSEKKSQFEELVEGIPYEQVRYADEIIEYASKKLNKNLNEYIYITLTDHINYAIERVKQGINFKNTLLWEIQRYYKEEYEVGLYAIDFINKEEEIELPIDEAGFIALHIVNAEMDDNDISKVSKVPGMIKDILNIVRYTFKIEFNEESLTYDRFVRHIKFFVERGTNNDYFQEEDHLIFKDFLDNYPQEFECSKNIKKHVENKTHTVIPEEELLYLTLHIVRVTRSK